MISLWGASYGILQPLLLAIAVPAILTLIYAYKRKGRGTPIPVASLIILQQLSQRTQAKDKFNPPLRFLVELLLLLILALALAGLYTSKEGDKIAVLIDNSASMQAIARTSNSQMSLFDQIIDRAKGVIDSANSNAFFHIYRTSPKLELVDPEFIGHDAAIETLSFIKTEYAPDNLQSELNTLAERSIYKKIIVFSDKQRLAPSQGESVDSNRVRLYSITGSDYVGQNVAISHISFQPDSLDESKGTLNVAVNAYTTAPLEVRVSLFETSSVNRENSPRALRSTNISLAPGATKQVLFERMTTSKAYRAELSVLSADEALSYDNIQFDNYAWISSFGGSDEFLLVGDLTPKKLGLSAIPGKTWLHLTPADFESSNLDELKSPILFHRYAPATLPATNSLFILPKNQNGLFEESKVVQNVEITRWLSSHPLTSYLNLPVLKLNTSSILTPPPWMQELISSTQGPVVLVGELEGVRYATFGFELLPFQGKNSPLLSVLTLNALKWLGSSSRALGYQSILTDIPERSDSNLSYLDILPDFTGERFFETQAPRIPGLLSVTRPAQSALQLALNFFDSSEADLRKPKFVSLSTQQKVSEQTDDRHLLYQRLTLLAFILVLIDLVFDFFPILTGALRPKAVDSIPGGAVHG